MAEDRLTKDGIRRKLAAQFNISQGKAGEIVDALFDAETGIIPTALKREDVVIAGFGTFRRAKLAARTYKAPTGGTVNKPARISIKFRAGKTLSLRMAAR